MSKGNMRSFRYSDEVAGILERARGDTLNAKFENLVLDTFWQREKLAVEIAQRCKILVELDSQVQAKRAELMEYEALLTAKQRITAELTRFVLDVYTFREHVAAVTQITPTDELRPPD